MARSTPSIRNTHRAFFGVCAIVLSLSLAVADGAPADDAPNTLQDYDWSGPYIGIQQGYVWADMGIVGVPLQDADGVLLGGHVGYNYQSRNIVLGVVGDVNYADLQDTTAFGPFFGATAVDTFDAKLTASIRAKVGISLDRFLLYATGGVAFADIEHGLAATGAVVIPRTNFRRTYVGYTVGGGIEVALNDRISTFAEYRYTDYGRNNFGGKGLILSHSVDARHHQIQTGLSIHVGADGLGGDTADGVPEHDWSGLYIGGQQGYVWADTMFVGLLGQEAEGVLAGGHVGYNFQSRSIVFGVVGDVNYADLRDTRTIVPVAGTTVTSTVEANLTASVRGRVGIALDRFLLYATGGIAFADIEHSIAAAGAVVIPRTKFRRTHIGYTVGGGFQVALAEWISVFAEYRYTDYGRDKFGAKGAFLTSHQFDADHHQIQTGFSIHFSDWLNGGR